MDYIRYAINNPVKVTVGVLLLMLFGFIGLFAIPVQLTPDVDRPIISVDTQWVGRSPEDVEREIIEPQEDKLKSISGLKKMTATASSGQATVTLEFYLATDMTRAFQDVSEKLRQVPSYPDDVDEPAIKLSEGDNENAVAWMVLTSDDPTFDVESARHVAEERVKPYLEQINGVSAVNVYGGQDREVHIRINPDRMAERGVTFNDLRNAMTARNVAISAGDLEEGLRDVSVRVDERFDDIETIAEIVIMDTPGGPIRVSDLGDVVEGFAKKRSFVRSKGEQALAMNIIRQTGANVIEVMQELHERLEFINRPATEDDPQGGLLESLFPGRKVKLVQVYDETVYIWDALNLVQSNLYLGGFLAAMVLLLFLRVIRPTLIVAISIPISIIGTFVVMWGFDRNINVISLAGLAFAVGMVVDNAIVVLENIDRHLGMGETPLEAAYNGGQEVWGAIFASTLTTLAVFLPVLFMQEEAGQLFRDISLAICAAVTLSLIIAITVIPTAASKFLRPRVEPKSVIIRQARGLFGLAKVMSSVVRMFADTIYHICRMPLLGSPTRVVVSVVGLLLIAVATMLIRGNVGEITGLKASFTQTWATLLAMVVVVGGVAAAAYTAIFVNWRDAEKRVIHAVKIGGILLATLFVAGFFVFFVSGQSLGEVWTILQPSGELIGALLITLVGIALLPPRISIISLFTVGSLVSAYLLMPPTSYLPSGNRNLVFAAMLAPPAYNVHHNEFIAERVEANLRPYWEAKSWAETEQLPPVTMMSATGPVDAKAPPVENFFFVNFRSSLFMGASSGDREVVAPLTGLINGAVNTVPGAYGFAFQPSIFGQGAGGGNAIDLEISASEFDVLRNSADAIFHALAGEFGYQAMRPDPANFNLPAPELTIRTNNVRARELGFDTADLGLGVRALIDGVNIGDFRLDGESVDTLLIRHPDYPLDINSIGDVPVAYRDINGHVGSIPLSELIVTKRNDAPQTILRIAEQRSVKLTILPPAEIPLEEAEARISNAVNKLRIAGVVPPTVETRPAGTAESLTQVREAMLGQWSGFTLETLTSLVRSRLFIALLVVYLLMAALFESFLYPFVIMFTVPLATVGGFIGLAIVHAIDPKQQLDVLTMLGFVILIGVVVNNAILLVHQSLNFMRGAAETEAGTHEPMPPLEAIRAAVRTRIRPIFMTTITSVFGMLPLVIAPALSKIGWGTTAGSELYQGLGSVVVGGLVMATVFTLVVVPLLFSLVLDAKLWLYRRFTDHEAPELEKLRPSG